MLERRRRRRPQSTISRSAFWCCAAGRLRKIAKLPKFRFGQPLTLLICYDSRASWKRGYDGREFGETDAAIVTTHMMLQAQALGLSSVWIGSFDPEKVREVFSLPEYLIPSAILPLGYEAEEGGHGEKKRRALQVEYL